MKKLLLLFSAFSNMVYAQHMYREASDNCFKNNYWYQVSDLCDAPGESSLRCDYCGLYYYSTSAKESHQKTCKYRRHIEFDYDGTGNRTEKRTIDYHHGRKRISYNDNTPLNRNVRGTMIGLGPAAIILKREEADSEANKEEIA